MIDTIPELGSVEKYDPDAQGIRIDESRSESYTDANYLAQRPQIDRSIASHNLDIPLRYVGKGKVEDGTKRIKRRFNTGSNAMEEVIGDPEGRHVVISRGIYHESPGVTTVLVTYNVIGEVTPREVIRDLPAEPH